MAAMSDPAPEPGGHSRTLFQPPAAESVVARETTTSAARPSDPSLAGLFALFGPPQAPDEIGRLGGYRVLRLIDRGGMGAVFEADEEALGRRVALKVMLSELAARPDARARFLREARSAAQLKN